MMINNMKAYELNEMEMKGVAGGYDPIQEVVDKMNQIEGGTSLQDAFSEAASTAWEVVKYAFEICG